MPADPLPPLPDEWQSGIDALNSLKDGELAILIGTTDRGKTTFTTHAARTLASQVERVAVVDTDVGQSEIGPPGTVGVAWAEANTSKLHDLKPVYTAFVGAFAPNSAALEHIVATGQAVTYARAKSAKRILVDTTGFVSGPSARRLKTAKVQTLRPNLILALAQNDELAGLLSVLKAASGAKIVTLNVPEAVGRKSPTLRSTRRLTRLSQSFTGARELVFPLEQVAILGATLGTGQAITPNLYEWAGNSIRLPVGYAERADGVLTLFLRGPLPRPGWEERTGPVADHFRVRTVRALSLPAYQDVLLGLHDETGRLLTIGRFLGLDAERGELHVSAPPPATAERVRLIAFGRVRVASDGSPLPEVRTGEI